MSLQILSSPSEQTEKVLKAAIEAALPGSEVEVLTGGAGHFELRVCSAEFAGKTRVAQQRLVYSAISHLMSGETAPVHAIDKMEIQIPEQSD
jgi:acid stress-induced BolA-like protein IbaG/YrbA